MPAKTSEVDPAASEGWIASLRTKPTSLAIPLGGNGSVMQSDKITSADQMRKAARFAGGREGCRGTMGFQQKSLVLTCEGDPPGGFEDRIREMLSDPGAALRLEMQGGVEIAEEEERAQAPPNASKPSSILELLMTTPGALGLEATPTDTAFPATSDDGDVVGQRHRSRLNAIAALKARADAVMSPILERQY